MKSFAFALAGLAVLSGTAWAETKSIPVQGLRTLEVEGPYEVVVTRGAPSAVLEGDAADLAKVGFAATAQGLRVWHKCNMFCNERDFDVTLRVSSPDLARLNFSKGVDAKVSDSTAPQMAINIAMGPALEIAGTCDTLRAKAAMGASLSASQLICRTADVQASMGAEASVHATGSVNAKAAMGASIDVAGNPARIDSDTGLGGSIDSN